MSQGISKTNFYLKGENMENCKMTMFEFGADGFVEVDQSKWLDLEAGRVLYFHGYSNDKYVIIGKGTGKFYETINLSTFQKRNQASYSLKHISEKKDNRIQVYITDEILDSDSILDAIDGNKKAEASAQAGAILAVKERDEQREKLIKDNSHLEQIPEGSYKTRVIGAKNIRKELKTLFPKDKFSVRGDSFSGGDSIHIEYPKDFDGDKEKIEQICQKYQQGSFDGMQDLYEYGHKLWTELFGGAKYVSCQRAWK